MATVAHYRRALGAALLATALTAGGMAEAGIVATGTNFPTPVVSGTANNYDIGNGAAGSLTINGGSTFTAGSLTAGNLGTGNGTILVDGAGTTVTLNPVGNVNVLQPGNWGTGSMTISGGAFVNGTNIASCAAGACGSFVANAAGTTGTLTVKDAGSQLDLATSSILVVGHDAVAGSFGTPGGGASNGTLNILSGGVLNSGGAAVGLHSSGNAPPANGAEIAAGTVLIDGTGSTWNISSGTTNSTGGTLSFLNVGEGANATGNLTISHAGAVTLGVTTPSLTSVLDLGGGGAAANAGGTGTVTVNGGTLTFTSGIGDAVYIGRNQGSGTMTIENGGAVSGFFTGSVGRDGSTGSLTIDGAGSSVSLSGSSTTGGAFLDVGHVDTAALAPTLGPSTNGTLTVKNGGKLTIDLDNNIGGGLQAGRNGGTGTITVTGAGSQIIVSGDNGNMTNASGGGVGRSGTGNLNILAGGQVVINNTGTGGNSGMSIGGTPGQVTAGEQPGTGTVIVSGAGSQLNVQSPHGFVTAGYSGIGTLDVANGGAVSAEGITAGRNPGSTGTVSIDGASTLITLAGADAPGGQGARLVVGRSGIGNVTVTGGAQLLINPSLDDGGLYVGGGPAASGGVGTMTVAGGSQVLVSGSNNMLVVGGNGTGTLTIAGGSTVDVAHGAGSTGQSFVGAAPASLTAAPVSGSIVLQKGATLNAGSLLGIASNGVANSPGTGAVFMNGGTVNAGAVVIGTNGFLAPSGTVNGNITNNGGTIALGAPPDILNVNGNLAQTGGNIDLEIAPNGSGGFLTDKLVFAPGSDIGVGDATILFDFVGGANPNTFAAAGLFNLDTFFRYASGTGDVPLSSELNEPLDQVFVNDTYLAMSDAFTITSFSFDPNVGVTQLTIAPEPSAAGLLASASLGLIGAGYARRRRRRAE